MKYLLTILLTLALTGSVYTQSLLSPSGNYRVSFRLTEAGEPVYSVEYMNTVIIQESKLGIYPKGFPNFANRLGISDVKTSSYDRTWKQVWGEESTVRDYHNELAITLKKVDSEGRYRSMIIRFRAANDGVGFRYEFPNQEHFSYFELEDERTEFALTGDHTTFWIPGDPESQEYVYNTTPLSGVNALKGWDEHSISTKSVIADSAVQSPLMMKTKSGIYLNIFEAALVNYPAMHLLVHRSSYLLRSYLPGNPVGSKAFMQTPCSSPWRTIIAGKTGADILNSRLVLNLNEPNVIKDVSFIKPQKFIGIWWELHVGKSSWNYGDTNNIKLAGMDWSKVKPNGFHGATTERTKYYIDFAAQHGFQGVLVEGWNVGWEDWFGKQKEDVFDFVTPYPDFDVIGLSKYAKKKGVKLVMHHETSASATNYERRMTDAFQFMKKYNYDAVKTGYVGRIIPRGEYHDGQWMVDHYTRVLQKAAEYGIMVDAHEPVRPTGLHRTYPNFMASEAARGNEFNAWSSGNPPEHETILPFTRLMGGPMDYTPGIFQITMDYYNPNKKERVHTTLAKQLALYVTMYSPFQMAADLPENYLRFPDAFQWIKDVAVDWDKTVVLEAEPGDYLTIARKAKGTQTWFVGAITDENKRTAELNLSFLDAGKKYTATVYKDGKDAVYDTNPMVYEISSEQVTGATTLRIPLAPGGGCAVKINPVK